MYYVKYTDGDRSIFGLKTFPSGSQEVAVGNYDSETKASTFDEDGAEIVWAGESDFIDELRAVLIDEAEDYELGDGKEYWDANTQICRRINGKLISLEECKLMTIRINEMVNI